MVAVAGIVGAAARWKWEQRSGHRNCHVEVIVCVGAAARPVGMAV